MKFIVIFGLMFIIPSKGKAIFDDKISTDDAVETSLVEQVDPELLPQFPTNLGTEAIQEDDDESKDVLVRVPRQHGVHSSMGVPIMVEPRSQRTFLNLLGIDGAKKGLVGKGGGFPDLSSLIPILGIFGGNQHGVQPHSFGPPIAYALPAPYLQPPSSCPHQFHHPLIGLIAPHIIQHLSGKHPALGRSNDNDQMMGVPWNYYNNLEVYPMADPNYPFMMDNIKMRSDDQSMMMDNSNMAANAAMVMPASTV